MGVLHELLGENRLWYIRSAMFMGCIFFSVPNLMCVVPLSLPYCIQYPVMLNHVIMRFNCTTISTSIKPNKQGIQTLELLTSAPNHLNYQTIEIRTICQNKLLFVQEMLKFCQNFYALAFCLRNYNHSLGQLNGFHYLFDYYSYRCGILIIIWHVFSW